MNQYIVDTTEQTSSAGLPGAFGPYSLTYLGADLEGLDAQPGTPVDGGPTISTAHQI